MNLIERKWTRVRSTLIGLMSAVVVIVVAPRPAAAHGVTHQVSHEGAAMVVDIRHDDGTPFTNESFEVYRPGAEVPFQVGRTDAHGRVVFFPDTTGSWRVKAFTADGHGLDITVVADSAAVVTNTGQGTADRLTRMVGGLAILFGAFFLMSLFYGKTRGGGG